MSGEDTRTVEVEVYIGDKIQEGVKKAAEKYFRQNDEPALIGGKPLDGAAAADVEKETSLRTDHSDASYYLRVEVDVDVPDADAPEAGESP